MTAVGPRPDIARPSTRRRPPDRRLSPERRALLFLGAALAACVAIGALWRLKTDLHLGVIPFHGGLTFWAGAGTPVAIAVGAALVVWLPVVGARARFPLLLVWSWLGTAAWAVVVASQQTWSDLSYPLTTRWDYWQALPAVRALGPGRFLATYVERLGGYPVHVQGHPPGMLLVLWGLDRIGLHGTGWAAATIIAIGATTPAAVLLAVRWWSGERAARAAFPFLVLSPAVLFIATVGDGVFAAVSAWAVAALVLAVRSRGVAATTAAIGAGALMAIGLHLSYGLAPLFAAMVVVVVVGRRRWALLGAIAVGGAAATAPFVAAGFRWWDGLTATRHWYAVGAASERPYLYFLFANLVAFAVVLGPGVVASLATRPPPEVVGLVAAGVVAVVLADVSGLSKGEVERIWLPMLPWVSLAVVGLVRRSSGTQVKRWLAGSVASTLTLQILVAWPW